jgi:serine/threonine-protein kinase HipA
MVKPNQELVVEIQNPSGTWIEVGLLGCLDDRSWFESFPSYWNTLDRPLLGQQFEERGAEWRPTANVSLPNWFGHLLPEGRLRVAVADTLRVNSAREFHLLSVLGGDDLPGAIRTRDTKGTGWIRGPGVVSEKESEDIESLIKFSLAGVQLKFSIERSAKGLTVPARGSAGLLIAKFPDTRPGYLRIPELEFAALHFASELGIDTVRSSLEDTDAIQGIPKGFAGGGAKALVVERFDRLGSGGQRVHFEEFAQILDTPPRVQNAKYKYANFETIGKVASGLIGPHAALQVVERVVLNTLIGNGDAHLKNWAVIYQDGKTASLAPTYDVLPTVLFIPQDDLGLKLNGSKRFAAVNSKSFDRLANFCFVEVSEAREVVERTVSIAAEKWNVLRELLTEDEFTRLNQHRNSLSI